MSAVGSVDFQLVPLAVRHQAATLEWMNDPALMPALNRLRIISPAEHGQWFAALPSRQDLACFAIEAGRPSRHVGNVWLHAIDPVHRRAEVRIMLAANEHGHGLGSAAIGRIADHAFREQGLHRLTACVLASNLRGRRAFEKAGFQLEGVLRGDRWTGSHFVDVYLFARIAA